ncbi:MAG: putative toxin-antitoxin system toxin component, PIN family [Nitrospirae bacterium]|nr:putative toxin-antitoxin system toxin component, PIN family [Nitrospirota bacterium]MBI3351214.1 putative toxin-antitoxin system toxin component, PIN family [Nitrospirota bacterium]
MRVILDTNVFISGVFFAGPPYQILKAWQDGKIKLLLSPDIFEEYERVGKALSSQFPSINLNSILSFITIKAEIIFAQELSERVSEDPDDDKFLACALSGKCKVIISGDKHLLRVSGFKGIEVIKPRQFFDEYLS